MMIEMLIVSLLVGVSLGTVFFLGLWWTVRRGLIASVPAAWFLLSFLFRVTVVMIGFYWIAQLGHWQHLAIALLGFVSVRMLLTWLLPSPKGEVHAS